jgi:branched-chain amino acid transport system permease protein
MTAAASGASRAALILAGLAAVVAVLLFVPAQHVARLNFIWIALISATGLNILIGLCGQVSLGQAAFMAIGGYLSAMLYRDLGCGLLVSVPAAAALAGLVGFLIGLPSLRLRGFYLALTTLALHFAVVFVAKKLQATTGGSAAAGFGIDRAMLGPIRIQDNREWFVLLAVLGTATLLGFRNITHSKVGRAWTAIRDRDIAASIIGVDVRRYKLLAFVVSSALAGAAGSLQAFYRGNVAIESYGLDLAISYIAMIIVGGLGSVVGTVLGVVVMLQLPFLLQTLTAATIGMDGASNFIVFDLQAGAFGLIIVCFLLFEPDGIVGLGRRIAATWRRQRGAAAAR